MVLQQDFEERHAAAFMITKIRSFKRETIFFFGGGGGGGELIRGTLRYIWLQGNNACILSAALCIVSIYHARNACTFIIIQIYQ